MNCSVLVCSMASMHILQLLFWVLNLLNFRSVCIQFWTSPDQRHRLGATTLPSEKSISPSKWSSFRDAHIITTIPTVCSPSDSHSRVNILQAGRASQPPDSFGAEGVNERIRAISGLEQRLVREESEQLLADAPGQAAAPRGEDRPGLKSSLSCWCWHLPDGVPQPQLAGLGTLRYSLRVLGLQSCERNICWRTGDFAVSMERRDTPRKLALESAAVLRALTTSCGAG